MIGHGVPVYQGYASQYGHGLGNVLGGYMRRAIPILKPWMKSTGKKLLLAGVNKLQQKLNEHPVQRQIGHGKRTTLQQKPKRGRGKKAPLKHKPKHKRRVPPGKKVVRKKTSTKPRDIFS